ncbi:MAG: hypothetical protein QOJ29_1997 [Thermoleophilaceae bacterium]|jgi:hypothetical protein|nr:hypothetical protein [Thermoleophilaceae bacterium]
MEASNGHHEMTPVLTATEARAIQPAPQPAFPAPVVAAAGGAVVGAFAYVLLRVLRRPARRRAAVRLGKGRGRRGLEVTGSRSFLVDVHMLKR